MQTLQGLLFPVLIIVVFYFFLIRPQQKRQKQRNMMLSQLKKGDKVVTIGGLHGSIVDLTDEKVTLKVSDNTRLVFERSAINSVVNADGNSTSKTEENKEETVAKAE
ncbi:preprotein translocase subunit YajC [Thermoflavimicrobium daqui]|uniref:Preprotein translocase subunit YajC n=2 Tax=Thermoflavimicrobium daqui TaxID=2137476 RepID=A0A364KA34_9BACL|nr:preprotein translocase subunit YajC [Thermoflavimicrobium daqui]RAL27102.1 preprotein translocase subunit YajC [Thermoflavimicrobium daqui]